MKLLQPLATVSMESRLSLRQLRAFVAVYRLRKLADAAQLLSVTPSAVSVLVRQMESGMGLRLFDRHTRALEPTAAAHDAIGRAERILGEIDALGGSLRGLGTRATGRVHLAATPAVGMVLLPAAVRRFVQAHPAIQLVFDDCAPNQFVPRILSGQVEFGIGTPDGQAIGIDQRVLVEDILCVVCPVGHPLAVHKQVRWAQLAGQPVIAGTPGYGVRRLTDAAAAQAGVELRVINEVNFLTSALWMVASGLGLAIFPAALAAASQHRDLVLRPLVAPKVTRSVSLVTRQGRTLSPASEGFVEVLVDTLCQAGSVPALKAPRPRAGSARRT